MEGKVKCLIVDDEQAAHLVLVDYIDHLDHLTLAGQCYNVMDAINFISSYGADLVFLDVHLPELNGFELLRSIRNGPGVILTSAYAEYALESYEYGVIDYLLKPISFPRFYKAVDRYLAFAGTPVEKCSSIIVKIKGSPEIIPVSSIIYTESMGNYVKIHTTEQSYQTYITTSRLEEKLPAYSFVRIHKSYIVAISMIRKFNIDTIVIGDLELPVGITYRRALMSRLKRGS